MSGLEGLPPECGIVLVISDVPHIGLVDGFSENRVHSEIILGPGERVTFHFSGREDMLEVVGGEVKLHDESPVEVVGVRTRCR